ncbi:MAG: hypothetical protein Q8L47_02210 [bacterium]|nr:hypothetical protein [bacterium]
MEKVLEILGKRNCNADSEDFDTLSIQIIYLDNFTNKSRLEKKYKKDAEALHKIFIDNLADGTYDKLHDLIHHHYCLKHSQRC